MHSHIDTRQSAGAAASTRIEAAAGRATAGTADVSAATDRGAAATDVDTIGATTAGGQHLGVSTGRGAGEGSDRSGHGAQGDGGNDLELHDGVRWVGFGPMILGEVVSYILVIERLTRMTSFTRQDARGFDIEQTPEASKPSLSLDPTAFA